MPSIANPPGSKLTTKPPRRLSRTHAPTGMSPADWQVGLRRQFGQEQPLTIRNLGKERVFSEYSVTNPDSKRNYRVAIRGTDPGVNYCSCPDYAVNTLGTCKHIEAVLHGLAKRHPAELKKTYAPPFAEVYVRYGTRREVLFSPGTEGDAALLRLSSKFFDERNVLRPEAYATFDQFVEKASPHHSDIRVYDDARALIAEVRDRKARGERLRRRYGKGEDERGWKNLLRVPLHPYQRDGALFAALGGRTIIADDMGLGKTIQGIAAAEILAKDGEVERVLILCPASLKSQWLSEIGQFSSRNAVIIEGPAHRRWKQYEEDPSFFKIANYDVVHMDVEAVGKWSPDLVILDEAQRIKNWQTRAAKTVKRIESRFATVLTGTPLENRLDELHSIVEFVDRFRLGPLFAFKAAHEECEPDTRRVVGYRDLDKIHRTLAPILIRRTKKEVLSQLPPRMDKNYFVPMTSQQWVPHEENKETVARLVQKWRRYKFLNEADQLRLRISLQNMRMSCDSTYLIDHETKHGNKVAELSHVLEEVLEDAAAKVVIFSQWVRMNELVIEMLEERSWGHVHLHGGVPSRQRKDLTQALREDDRCRVFLSTDAGGVGLNLQRASTIVNMDLPWNPAVLEQRIGRIHRMGQKNPVRVVNFVAENTIEHGMLSLLSFKRSVFSGVLDGTTDKVHMGQGAMSRFIQTIEKATGSVPPAPEPTPLAEQLAAAESAETEPQNMQAPFANVAGAGDLRGLLNQGAALLQGFAAALAADPGSAVDRVSTWLTSKAAHDSVNGKRELRIPLPDEMVLRGWVTQLATAVRSLRR